MADINRHTPWRHGYVSVQEQQWPVFCEVKGSTVIEAGDLLFMDRVDGLRNNGTSTANNTAYPFATMGGSTKTLASNQLLASNNFLGVAMFNSQSGVTETLATATSGKFKFPLKSPKTVRLGNVVMPSGSGSSLYSQKVVIWSSGTTYDLGMVVRTRARSSNVEFILRPTVIALGDPIAA